VPLIEKQPEVRVIPFAKVEDAVSEVALKMLAWSPPMKVEVAVEVDWMTDVSSPFQKLPKLESSLPENVDVAVELELSAPLIESPPFVTVKWPKTEEEARETKPELRVESPETARVEEAESAPPRVKEFCELIKVERLPEVLKMSKMFAVWFATGLIAKVVVAVEVEVIPKTA